MKRRLFGNLVALCDEAERLIRSAGRPVPPREDLMAALAPRRRRSPGQPGRRTVRRGCTPRRSRWRRVRRGWAPDSVAGLAAAWAEAVPTAERYSVAFDTARFRVALERVPPGEQASVPAQEVA